jgi:hypothetical protein
MGSPPSNPAPASRTQWYATIITYVAYHYTSPVFTSHINPL